MPLEVLVGYPMLRPSGLHENCFAPHINRNKGLSINCPARHAFGARAKPTETEARSTTAMPEKERLSKRSARSRAV